MSPDTMELEDRYQLPLYPKRDIVIVRGKGAKLYDDQGREYIDCAANVGVNNIGHGNGQVAEAIGKQYLTLGNCYGIFYNDVRATLGQKLAEITPGGLERVFFCNSGTESVEAAIKFARATTGRGGVVAAMRGFHGKTMGSLGATWGRDYRTPFKPLISGFQHAPFNKFEKLEEKVGDDTAAILLECVQGEGGVRIGDPEYFTKVREMCDERDILLIIDEVQTGFGRTGRMFACQRFAEPDIMCMAKSMAGGVPMGAVMCSSRIEVPRQSHTSTFGGNPLACSASLAAIDFIEGQGLVQRAEENGNYLLDGIKALDSDKIREARGLGLMIGIELKERSGRYVQALMDQGIIALLAGPLVIRLLPPLVITREECDQVLEALEAVLC